MDQEVLKQELSQLIQSLEGDLYLEEAYRLLYATDASAYRQVPLAVARPRHKDDIRQLIHFAGRCGTSLIPRTAGTSLAGQVVGGGMVVDVSRYMTRILELNVAEKWVRVEPGVVLDELNKFLEPYGLFFGPEASTSNRCMIGGMVGNNACGAHSLIYGSTRDHTLELHALLSDGSEAVFRELSRDEFLDKCSGPTLENRIYQNISEILTDPGNQKEIREQFPDPSIRRRNTGYAIDLLLDSDPFTRDRPPFNFCRLLAGSEGTLAFITEIKLNLVSLPPKTKGLLCVHFHAREEAFYANLIALSHHPGAIELIDHHILDQTKHNLEQSKNRFFVQGDPAAVLIIEFARDTREEIISIAASIQAEMQQAGYGYHFPLLFGSDIPKVWSLRKAGLGLLTNIPGDAKPVSIVEDTAVRPIDLPHYLAEFQQLMDRYGTRCVYHAHIATGELHLRPVLNLKKEEEVRLFHDIARETALLVRKYKGSFSGEHGDGRVRGEFIPLLIGEKNYQLLRSIKKTWDPQGIFNPGKITDTPSMMTDLRYSPGQVTRELDTFFDFSDTMGLLRAVEQCNGSGDCRKSELIGGVMCPSYMATRDENTTTRARANILREFLTRSPKKNPFDHEEILAVMDLCLSCKGCKSECPSSVDMTMYKAEFLQHYHDAHGIPLRTRLIADINRINQLASLVPGIYNAIITNRFTSSILKRIMGFAHQRSIPALHSITLSHWHGNNFKKLPVATPARGKVYLFADEFTEYNDTDTGIKAIKLLNALGYEVIIPPHKESGRAMLSKGLLRKVRKIAEKNVALLKDIVTSEVPLVGIEPSCILTFRDEYPRLVREPYRDGSRHLAENTFLLDEFIIREARKGNIPRDAFTLEKKKIRLHGHCHQKALASTSATREMLSLPVNYTVEEIPSGCCGMAGSFGYEKEHYDLSRRIGELVLFPAVRASAPDVLIAAPGTSCRHQILEGTGRRAYHPIEILYDALK
ncbi:MAG: FAD-linked oxidase C-terminal domain-containing protein [Bacteroidales bacterium]|nr:FAD-linked oxidase C-terminal domain-containing protein [Bacteroidales bacterium]